MKVDLHVHTRGSHGAPEHWLAELLGGVGVEVRESYTSPHAAVAEALRKGMDAVAITDHDSAADALALARERPDRVIPGCEYTVYGGRGRYAHVVVLGIDEEGHRRLSRERRRGVARFTEAARGAGRERGGGYAFFLAHPAWEAGPEKRGIDPAALCEWLEHFDVIETLNGHCTAENEIAQGLARYFRKAGVGGSDSHALTSIGETWTESPARTAEGFLDDVRAGNVRAGGTAGGVSVFAATAREVFAAFCRREFLKAARERGAADGGAASGLARIARTALGLLMLPGYVWGPKLGTRSRVAGLERRAAVLGQRLADHLELALARRIADPPAGESSDERARLWTEGTRAIRAAFP